MKLLAMDLISVLKVDALLNQLVDLEFYLSVHLTSPVVLKVASQRVSRGVVVTAYGKQFMSMMLSSADGDGGDCNGGHDGDCLDSKNRG
jgi:hypothetical protein